MKNQSQRDLQRHWAEQSKKQTPSERLQTKAEKLRKQIERDKAFLERRRKGSPDSESQPAAQAVASGADRTKPRNSKSSTSARPKAKE